MNPPSNCRLNPAIIANLDRLIRECNVFTHTHRMQGKVEQEVNQAPIIIMQTAHITFRRVRNEDRRRYNLPPANEVAMIFPSHDGQPPFERDFSVYPYNDTQALINLNILSPNLDPMVYPIFYS